MKFKKGGVRKSKTQHQREERVDEESVKETKKRGESGEREHGRPTRRDTAGPGMRTRILSMVRVPALLLVEPSRQALLETPDILAVFDSSSTALILRNMM